LIQNQARAETEGASPDAAGEPFAAFCEIMFAPQDVPPAHREALRWLGRNVGRWIYLADALDDCEEDARKGRFNSLGTLSREQAAAWVLPEMNLCADQALCALDVLPQVRHASIIRNILDVGLFTVAQALAKGALDKTLNDTTIAGQPFGYR
jgi:hypothetical protein